MAVNGCASLGQWTILPGVGALLTDGKKLGLPTVADLTLLCSYDGATRLFGYGQCARRSDGEP